MADEHPDDDGDNVAEARVGAHQRPDEVGQRIPALTEGNRLAQHDDEEHANKKRDEQREDGTSTNLQHVGLSAGAGAGAPARGRPWPGPRENARA